MSSSLGDLIPDETRRKITVRLIKEGAVIRMSTIVADPGRASAIKRVVIVAISNDGSEALCFLINSHDNPRVNYKEKARITQMPLLKSKNSYLDHNSFLDCYRDQIKSVSSLERQVASNPGSLLGYLSDLDLELAKRTAANSGRLTMKVIKRFGLFDFLNPS